MRTLEAVFRQKGCGLFEDQDEISEWRGQLTAELKAKFEVFRFERLVVFGWVYA